MGKIIINRKNEFQQRLRRFTVLIDGRMVGEVRNGNAEEFKVAEGVHKVKAKYNWFSSQEYECYVGENEVKFLQVQANLPFFWLMYIALFAALLTPFFYKVFTGTRELPETLSWFRLAIISLLILYYFYFLMIKRKSYLKITEDTKNIFNT